MLVEGTTDLSDLRALAHKAKQLSAYDYRRRERRRLWQPSYWDHVLREDESILPFVRYILENPVRAGLVDSREEYPYLGAGEMSVSEVLRALAETGVDAWEPPHRGWRASRQP